MKPSEKIKEYYKKFYSKHAHREYLEGELVNINALTEAIGAVLDESQEPKALEEAYHRSVCACPSKNCFRPEPQDEPKECSFGHGTYTGTCKKCEKMTQVPHQESETGWREDLAISHLRIVLPMAKAYAASSDVGSNREYVEAADIFLKSLEK